MAKKSNSNLRTAKREKKDEFYTQLKDIEKELYVYGNEMQHFKNKIILCPCDESEHTNFFKHFMAKREEYGWKSLICVGYRENRPAEVHVVEKCGPDIYDYHEKNLLLDGNGDFRNEETQVLFDMADVIVTNPPFSLFREFIELLEEKQKKYLIIGNINAITYKEIFPLIKNNKMWPGYSFNENVEFSVPEGYKFKRKDENGQRYGTVPGIAWFTNLEIPKRYEELNTGIDFDWGNSNGWYKKYDNYDAININRCNHIPMDYDGIMGVPITFLDLFNPNQFEIIGLFNRYSECDYENGFICGNNAEYEGKDNEILRSAGPVVNRKPVYARILIRHKR